MTIEELTEEFLKNGIIAFTNDELKQAKNFIDNLRCLKVPFTITGSLGPLKTAGNGGIVIEHVDKSQ